jgi:hypothetical protein
MCCFMPAVLEAAPRGTSALHRSQTAIPSQLRSVYTLKYCHHSDVHPSGFFTGHRLRSSSQASAITASGSAAAAVPLMANAHKRTECRDNGGKKRFEIVKVQPLDMFRICFISVYAYAVGYCQQEHPRLYRHNRANNRNTEWHISVGYFFEPSSVNRGIESSVSNPNHNQTASSCSPAAA